MKKILLIIFVFSAFLVNAQTNPDVETMKLRNMIYNTASGSIDTVLFANPDILGQFKLKNISDPVYAQDAATKKYVDDNNGEIDNKSLRKNIALTEYSHAETIVASVWTYTITEVGATGELKFNINEEELIYPGSVMSVEMQTFAGTDLNPKQVYVYVQNDGADVPELVASNTNPDGVLNCVEVANFKAGTVSASDVTIYGEFSSIITQLEFVNNAYHKFWDAGTDYYSGMDVTAIATDVSISAGVVKTLFEDVTTTLKAVIANGLFYIKSDGTYNSLNNFAFTEYSTGEAISADKFYWVTLGVISDVHTSYIMAIVQAGDVIPAGKEYKNIKQAMENKYQAIKTAPSDPFLKNLFVPRCRIVIKNDANDELQEVPEAGSGIYFIEETGDGSGGGVVPTSTNIIDGTVEGQMTFWDATNNEWTPTETTELLWDDTNKRLGIGTATPDSTVHIVGSEHITTNLLVDGTFTVGGVEIDDSDNITGVDDLTANRFISNTNTTAAFIGNNTAGVQAANFETRDASTNTVLYPLVLGRETTGTAANGIGTGIYFEAESTTGSTLHSGRITNTLTDATTGSYTSKFSLWTRNNTAIAENFIFNGAGNQTNTGLLTIPSIKLSTGAALGKVLTSDATGLATWETPATGITGTGTNGYMSKWTSSTTQGNSIVQDQGIQILVNGDVRAVGALTLLGGTSGYDGFKAAAISESAVYELPNTDGTVNQVMTTDGARKLSWATGGVGDMVLSSVQSVTGLKTFDKDKLAMKGTSTGVNTISVANTSATSYTNTIPAKTGTFAMTSDITGTDLSLSTGTNAVAINSSTGTNATIGSATTSDAGIMTKTIFDQHTANNAKATNVSTNLSEGTATTTTVDVDSSDGTNATLVAASTSRAGLLTKAKFDEVVVNTTKLTADVTNVTAAGALMDSEVDADIKTLVLPASTTISTFGASLIDDVAAINARSTLDVDQAGTDNSTAVTLNASATTGGMSISTQEISNRAATNAQTGYMTAALVGNIETNNDKVTYPGDQTISDATITFTDITTGNVSSAKHGFAPKGDGTTTKFLNANGAYSTPAGGGDVTKVGTPVDNQVGVWTGDGTLEGDANFTWSGTKLDITGSLETTGAIIGDYGRFGDNATDILIQNEALLYGGAGVLTFGNYVKDGFSKLQGNTISTGTGGLEDYITIGQSLVAFNKNAQFEADLKDISGDSGTAGQILSSLAVGNGTNWIDAPIDGVTSVAAGNGLDFTTITGTGSVTMGTPSTTTGTSTNAVTTTSHTHAITDAVADGSTQGVASFTANDFNATTGNISIDYVNGQKATNAQPGLATAAQITALEANSDKLTANETNVVAALDGATITGVTVATGDKVIIQDITDSDNIKTVTAQSIADLATGDVTSVFTRAGAVVATIGDYTAAQVTNAFDKSTTNTVAGVTTWDALQKIINGNKIEITGTGSSPGNYWNIEHNATLLTFNQMSSSGGAETEMMSLSPTGMYAYGWTDGIRMSSLTIHGTHYTELKDTTGGAMLRTIEASTTYGGWRVSQGQMRIGDDGATTNVPTHTLEVAGDAYFEEDIKIVETATAGESLVAGNLVYLKSDGKYWKTDADAAATTDGVLLIALATISADAAGLFLKQGIYTTTGLTAGSPYFVSTTAGAILKDSPTTTDDFQRKIGFALSTTELEFNPSPDYAKVQ